VKDLDDLVTFFHNRGIPMAINHCVSIYPSEDRELELNRSITCGRGTRRITIGFSTHEHNDWASSMLIAYAKGARTSSGTSTLTRMEFRYRRTAPNPNRPTHGLRHFTKPRRCAARRAHRSACRL
jgi:hypothetical protein